MVVFWQSDMEDFITEGHYLIPVRVKSKSDHYDPLLLLLQLLM